MGTEILNKKWDRGAGDVARSKNIELLREVAESSSFVTEFTVGVDGTLQELWDMAKSYSSGNITINIPEGNYEFEVNHYDGEEINITNNITLKGAGKDLTTVNFSTPDTNVWGFNKQIVNGGLLVFRDMALYGKDTMPVHLFAKGGELILNEVKGGGYVFTNAWLGSVTFHGVTLESEHPDSGTYLWNYFVGYHKGIFMFNKTTAEKSFYCIVYSGADIYIRHVEIGPEDAADKITGQALFELLGNNTAVVATWLKLRNCELGFKTTSGCAVVGVERMSDLGGTDNIIDIPHSSLYNSGRVAFNANVPVRLVDNIADNLAALSNAPFDKAETGVTVFVKSENKPVWKGDSGWYFSDGTAA